MQTLTSGAEGGSEAGGDLEVVEREDPQGARTTSTRGARESTIDTMERKPHFSSSSISVLKAYAVTFLLRILKTSVTFIRGISPEEKRGGRGPWNWGCVEETTR